MALRLALVVATASCTQGEAREGGEALALIDAANGDYCALPATASEVLAERPGEGEEPVDDVNWFARPVPHAGDDWIVAFASHNQNYLYNLTKGRRIRIPDRSDAVATPDGRYLTVPSYYTADSTTRFYPLAPMLDALERSEDADGLEPAFVHDHPAMRRVYYQSTALVSADTAESTVSATYRLMFSGTNDESRVRLVDYRFVHDRSTRTLRDVRPSPPMTICAEITNDLNTPFISKDGRYVASYSSDRPGSAYAPGASLKLFEITATDPDSGTTTCRQAIDFGFAAGKADFSFDNSMLTFHLSQGAYLTPFVNGGLPSTTITDVMVARFDRDHEGAITGHSGLQRLTVSLEAGVGSYFPAFFPDGRIFYIANAVPSDSDQDKRFHFRVVDPVASSWQSRTFDTQDAAAHWSDLGELWQRACVPAGTRSQSLSPGLASHEAPLQALPLNSVQCEALVQDGRTGALGEEQRDWTALNTFCGSLARPF